jgi:tetratricopeptide (TPR) repeat protein
MIAAAVMNAKRPSRHQIFVSYSRQDADWAGAFVDTLKKRGWSIFLDTRTIKAGDEWSPEIDAAIDAAKVVIALWSARSVKSSYVTYEAARAVVRGTLVPLSIDRTQAPPAFRRFQAQAMHIDGARSLPSELVAAIETRLVATLPPAPPSAEEQRLRDELEQSATIARESGVPLLALQAQLERLGESNVAPEAMAARLESFVSEFLKLKADLARPTNADPDVATTQGRALDLMNAGDLDGARTLIDDAVTRRRELHRQTARETAALLADRARIDTMQLRHLAAAEAYEEAAELLSFDPEVSLICLRRMAAALISQGDQFNDDDALARAIELLETRALPLAPRERAPMEWAMIQGTLGNALQLLGECENSTARMRKAMAAYRAALEEFTRDRDPENWALTQNNLGNALSGFGDLEDSTVHHEGAVIAYRAALEEFTRDRFPLGWAMVQNNLGTALKVLGARESSTVRLEEAVAAYRAALEEYTRNRVPMDSAMAQHNLGLALGLLGEREGSLAHLEEAAAAFGAALEVRTRDRLPFLWERTQKALDETLALIAKRSSK